MMINRKKLYSYTLLGIVASVLISFNLNAMKEQDERENTQGFRKNQQEDQANKVVNLRKQIAATTQKVAEPAQDGTHVLFLGRTGSGKSALVSLLGGGQLQSELIPHTQTYRIQEGEFVLGSGIEIGNSDLAHTTIPHFVQHDALYYWDCPGFGDNRSDVQDIVNAYAIQKLLQRGNIRIVGLIEESAFQNERGRLARQIMRDLETLFPNQLDDAYPALSFCITKKSPGTNMMFFLETIMGWPNIFTDDPSVLLNRLATDEQIAKKFSYISQPTSEGNFHPNDELAAIEHTIGSTEVIQGNITPQLVLSETAQRLIESWAIALNDEISNFMKETVSAEIRARYHRVIAEYDGPDIAGLNRALGDFKSPLNGFLQWTADTIAEGLRSVISEQSFSQLTRQLESLLFCSRSNQRVQIGITVWQKVMRDLLSELGVFSTKRADPVYDQTRHTYTYTAPFLCMTQMKILNTKPNDTVVVKTTQALVFDADITMPSTHFVLKSPLWKILGQRKISLSGRSGKAHPLQTRCHTELDGKDGQHGNPGQHGGHFRGKGDQFFGIENLFVKSNGGNGGKGQNGGDGQDGKMGADPTPEQMELLRNRSINPIKQEEIVWGWTMWAVKTATTFNRAYKLFYSVGGEKGSNGGDAGKGGRGGVGGNSGTASLRSSQGQTLEACCEQGKTGRDGVHGKFGKGGRYGRYYKGTYISEGAFGSFTGVLSGVGTGSAYTAMGKAAATEVVEESTKKIAGVAVKTAARKGLARLAAQEAARVAVGEATRRGAASTAISSSIVSMGTGLAVQSGLSIVSAYICSGWDPEHTPRFVESEKFAPDGNPATEHNPAPMEPSQPLKTAQELDEYLKEDEE